MNRIIKCVMDSVVVFSMGIAVMGGALYLAGGRINTSKSIPLGLYWMRNVPITKGEYVIFCPPQRAEFADAKERGYIGSGFCPGTYGYMMKKVFATGGDIVSVTAQGVIVNGQLLPGTKPMPVDPVGRPLPHVSKVPYTLTESEILLMSDHEAMSFDARYFGPITRAYVQSVIQPVFTW